MLLTRIRPSIWVRNIFSYPSQLFPIYRVKIPVMELVWSSCTVFLATSTSFKSLVFIRFFVGKLFQIYPLSTYLTHPLIRLG
jgi:hypothetical protein